jgi:hypothetical protein
MGSIGGLTAQANAIGGCSSPQDCCNEINGLKGTIVKAVAPKILTGRASV